MGAVSGAAIGGGFAGFGCAFSTIADVIDKARDFTGVDLENCAVTTAKDAAEGAVYGAAGAVSLKAFGSIVGSSIRTHYSSKAIDVLFGGRSWLNGAKIPLINKGIGKYLRIGLGRDGGQWSFRAGGSLTRGFMKAYTRLTGKKLPGDKDHWIILKDVGKL